MTSLPGWLWAIVGFLIYVVLFFITFFFGAALVACAMVTLEGGTPTVGYGLGVAASKAGKILAWAVISAIVGLVLQALESRAGILGRIAIRIAGAAWTVATYFVVPVIVFEDVGAWASMKRSWALLKGSWGEALVSYIGMGIVFALLAIGGLIPVILVAMVFKTLTVALIAIVAYVVYLVFLAALAATARGVIQAALYRYATTGKLDITMPAWFPPPQTAYAPMTPPSQM